MPSDSNEPKRKHPKKKGRFCCFAALKLLVAGLPTIAFGVFTIIFSLQQESSSKAMRDQDQRQADENNRRILFKEYIDDMKELLLDKDFQENMNKSLLHMRVQTLTVLKYLDGRRKCDVILYLYENGLLRHDQTPNLNLRGADLTGLEFTRSSTASCDLSFLYLPGILGTDVKFNHCSLQQAIFQDAELVNAQFHSCDLTHTRFIRVNLTKAKLINNLLHKTVFSDSYLSQSSIQGDTLVKVTIFNVDLYQSDISDQLLFGTDTDGSSYSFISHTRFPNGSFSPINYTAFINNHHSKFQCPSSKTTSTSRFGSSRIDNCILLSRRLRFYALDIDLSEVSLLIDTGQAKFNLSTLLTLNYTYTDEEISMTIIFKQRHDPVDGRYLPLQIKPYSLSAFYSLSGMIPPMTRFLSVRLLCEMSETSTQFCRFDDLMVVIVNNGTSVWF